MTLPTSANAKFLITERGDATYRLLTAATLLADLDRDGGASFLAGADCDELDATVHAGAADAARNCLRVWHPTALAPAETPIADPSGLDKRAGSAGDRPNKLAILVVMIDALRADHLDF